MPFSRRFNRRTVRMLLVNRIKFKMATNRVQSSTSDFSIDHILNRAGDQFATNGRKCDQYETKSMNSSGSSSGDESSSCDNFVKSCYRNGYVENERFMEIPAFDWLNYTRYNMPRISRKFSFSTEFHVFHNFNSIRSNKRSRKKDARKVTKNSFHAFSTQWTWRSVQVCDISKHRRRKQTRKTSGTYRSSS